MHEPDIYRISIKGRLDPKWVNRLEEMNLTEATSTSDEMGIYKFSCRRNHFFRLFL